MAALVRIEGIGEKYADCLSQAGIGSTATLLAKGATRAGRATFDGLPQVAKMFH